MRTVYGWRPALLAPAIILLSSCQRGDNGKSAVGVASGAKEAKVALTPFFEDVTPRSGIDAAYRNGEEAGHYSILESLGGGVALFDYDGDGRLDVFIVTGGRFDGADQKSIRGHPNKLYKNLGDWKFKDVTQEAGLDQARFYGHGAAVADYDRDGWPDLLVTGYGGVCLYRNDKDAKGRRFTEVTKEAGLAGAHSWATSAAWGDFDGDGFPDLYVCSYVDWSFANHTRCKGYAPEVKHDICSPLQFEARPHRLYRNLGKGRFAEAAKEAGLRWQRDDKDYGKGLGVIVVDVNGDFRPDIYVANDTTDNLLYINRGKPGAMRFEELGLEWGVARDHNGVSNGSMGVDAADFDGSGRPSLWVTNYENELHGLYRNTRMNERTFFNHCTQITGIAAIGQEYVGFGTGFLDLDNDGWEDLFISNGHVMRHPFRHNLQQRPVLLRNQGGRFEDAAGRGGPYFAKGHRGRGVAFGDLDNDGRLDVVVSHVNEPVALLRNVGEANHHWLGVELVTRDKRDLVGSKLTLKAGGRTLTRFVKGGGSYLSANDPRLLFGLGKQTMVDDLVVEWTTGSPTVERWRNLPVDRYHRVEQGSGEAVTKSTS